MADVKRIYVEKKEPYAVAAKELKQELKSYLGIDTLSEVRVLIRYDVESISEDVYKKALVTVFSEPPVDDIYEGSFPKKRMTRYSLWNIYRDSSTSVPIRQSSV